MARRFVFNSRNSAMTPSDSTPVPLRVLVVDDTPANIGIVINMLADAGLEVQIATGGEKALELIAIYPPDLVLLDVRQACDFADYFVILSAQSPRQVRNLIEEIDSLMKAQGVGLHHLEGTHEGGWVLMDFGDVIVHILTPDEREFYDLERVWPKAVELVRLQ